jgi:hypothetical protein
VMTHGFCASARPARRPLSISERTTGEFRNEEFFDLSDI